MHILYAAIKIDRDFGKINTVIDEANYNVVASTLVKMPSGNMCAINVLSL